MTNFGETDSLSEQDEALAEKYLIHVLADIRSTTTAVTFNQLKWENYSSARVRIDSLPATSSVIRSHILRGVLLVHEAYHLYLLMWTSQQCGDYPDPLNYGTLAPCATHLAHTVQVRMLNGVGAVLVEFAVSHSAMGKGTFL